MDVTTSLTAADAARFARGAGYTRAIDLGTTFRTVERIRTAGRCAFFAVGFLSIVGAADLLGTLSGLR